MKAIPLVSNLRESEPLLEIAFASGEHYVPMTLQIEVFSPFILHPFRHFVVNTCIRARAMLEGDHILQW